ncbi:MAG: isochorismate synthase [Ignavibacteriales bacterium]|nr:isochorismate synthase [Ignavibacteriales bacterium]
MTIIDKQKLTEYISQNNKRENQSGAVEILQYAQNISEENFHVLLKQRLTSGNYFYWNKPADNFSFLAIEDENRFFEEKNFASANFKIISGTKGISFPLIVGGLKFPTAESGTVWNDFEKEKWIIPKFLLVNSNEEYFIVVNFLISLDNFEQAANEAEKFFSVSDTQPGTNINMSYDLSINGGITYDEWHDSVNNALKTIYSGKIYKVVLARNVEAELEVVPPAEILLKTLEEQYPDCYTFAYKQNDSLFFGATPEKLFKLENQIIETEALAGSIKRGKDIWEDDLLASQLLNNPKDIAEHKSVLDFIIQNLSELSSELEYDAAVQIKKLNNIQHIWTPIKAKLESGKSIFEIIEKIYPTPAVCGYPKNSALKLIEELETFDRGMYAGLIGWFNGSDGEFAVAIRSALIKNNRLFAYAGCGIVDGSTPELEYKETELKLKPILSLFENETINQS